MPVPLIFPNLASLLPGPDVAVRKPEPFTFMSQLSPFLQAAVDTTQKVVAEYRDAKDHQAELDTYAKFFDEQGNPEIANLLRSQRELIKPNISGAIYGESQVSKSRSQLLNGLLSFAKGQQSMDLAERRTAAYEAKQKSVNDFNRGFSQSMQLANQWEQKEKAAQDGLEVAESNGDAESAARFRKELDEATRMKNQFLEDANRIKNNYNSSDPITTPGAAPSYTPKAKPVYDDAPKNYPSSAVIPDVAPAEDYTPSGAASIGSMPTPPVTLGSGGNVPRLPTDSSPASNDLLPNTDGTLPTEKSASPVDPERQKMIDESLSRLENAERVADKALGQDKPVDPFSSISLTGEESTESSRPVVSENQPSEISFYSQYPEFARTEKRGEQRINEARGLTSTPAGVKRHNQILTQEQNYKPEITEKAKSAFMLADEISKRSKESPKIPVDDVVRQAHDQIRTAEKIIKAGDLNDETYKAVYSELDKLNKDLIKISATQKFTSINPDHDVSLTSGGGYSVTPPFKPRQSMPSYIDLKDESGGYVKFQIPGERVNYIMRAGKGPNGTVKYFLVNPETQQEFDIQSFMAGKEDLSLAKDFIPAYTKFNKYKEKLAKDFEVLKNYVILPGEDRDATQDQVKEKAKAQIQEALSSPQ